MIHEGKGWKTIIICYSLVISIIGGLFAYNPLFVAYAEDTKTGIVRVTGALNVRTGPGTSYDRLTYNGSTVQLTNGTAVEIVNEQYASDGATWYEIAFTYSNQKLTGFVHGTYIYIEESVDYEPDADFETYLTEQGFPESYKDGLRSLHTKYPNWVFICDQLDYDWDEVVKNESLTGRSLIAKSSISSWKSTATDAYNWNTGVWYGFDGGSWAAASEELVAYALDPRNFLTETYVFQFELLSYQSSYQTEDGVKEMVKGSFMENTKIRNDDTGKNITYAAALIKAAVASGVSPYALASSIVQEQGSAGTSDSISGTLTGYEGFYNYYNWNAFASGGNSAVVNGLIYAQAADEYSLRPWNSRYKAIIGGAKLFGKNYINIGQDTLYYKKFDFVGTPYTHQYMTHIIAARQEGVIASQAYSDEWKKSAPLVFKIPVFKNMPDSVCKLPDIDGSPNNCLKTLTVSKGKMTPSFTKFTTTYDVTVANSVSGITIKAAAIDDKATISGAKKYSLKVGSNRIRVKIKAENGDVRTYTIYVTRRGTASEDETETETEEPETVKEPVYSVKTLTLNNRKTVISGISEKTSVTKMKRYFTVKNGSVQVVDAKGKIKKGNMATGDVVQILNTKDEVKSEIKVVLYGDVNGDGQVTIKDAFLMRKVILGRTTLKGVFKTAADVTEEKDGLTIKDAFLMKRHILGEKKISQ